MVVLCSQKNRNKTPGTPVFLNPGPGCPPTLHILSPLSDTLISGPEVSSNELNQVCLIR